MTNRGAANLNVEVKKPTDSDKVTSVSIGLERVVAKVELTQTQETFPLTDPSGKTYCTIKLNNFRMLNLATQFYTFRHTAVLNSFQEPDSYTDENFGDINDNNGYVIDPYFFKKTENYSCYYNYWIKHLDNNSPEMGVMEFGIVRNNIYRLSVNKIAGLGSGKPFIDPDQPDEYKAELDINFNVFPWAVRNQDVELE